MGIIHSIIRFLCSKTQIEDEDSGRSSFLVHQPNQDYVQKLPYKPITNKDPNLRIKNNPVLSAVTFANSAATSQIPPPPAHFVDIGTITKLDDRIQLRYYDATSRQWRLPKSITKDTTQKAFSFAEDESKKKIVVEKPKEKKEATINNNIVKSSSTSSTRVVAAAVDDARWIKHYSSRHRVLVVGDGDFSFSASLAVAFGRASNMIATSLDSLDFLMKNYWNAKLNIEELRSRGCMVIHGVDVTKMANHHSLGHLNFDRIVYNFPYAGLFKHLSRDSQLRLHRRLVSLFLKNAKQMINEDGEIHISHKTNGFHEEWKLVSIASSHGFRLIEAVDFDLGDYPGYNTKYGFGGDDNFNCYPSSTYKFGLKILN